MTLKETVRVLDQAIHEANLLERDDSKRGHNSDGSIDSGKMGTFRMGVQTKVIVVNN